MLKKRLAGIWDELYGIKKLFKGGGEYSGLNDAGGEGGTKTKSKIALAKIEDRVNYASEELGAQIIHVKAEPICSQNLIKSLMGMDFSSNPPIRMLRSSMEPGSCFAYKEDKAEVTIHLAHEVGNFILKCITSEYNSYRFILDLIGPSGLAAYN